MAKARRIPALSRRAERLAETLHRAESWVQQLRERLGVLSPVGTLDKLLRTSKVTTLWYAQRLSDMGMTLTEIYDQIGRVMNLPGGDGVMELPPEWAPAAPPRWMIRMRVGRRAIVPEATHTPPSHSVLMRSQLS